MLDWSVSAGDGIVEVQVRAILPTSGGCAVFLGNEEKNFVIYVDQTVGAAISMFMQGIPKERPQTHDLMATLLVAFGARLLRVVINDFHERVYFARMILEASNEIMERKLIEVDARPSDSIALAAQQGAPILVSREVWDNVEDMTELLEKMEEQGFKGESGDD